VLDSVAVCSAAHTLRAPKQPPMRGSQAFEPDFMEISMARAYKMTPDDDPADLDWDSSAQTLAGTAN